MNEYEKLIEKILTHFAGPQFQDEVRMAKREFFDSSSIFDESSPHFELRMNQFFDWYFFTRPLKGYEQTPLESAILPRELKYTPQEIEQLEVLKRSRHSLFEFIKFKDGDIHVRDLLADKKMVVKKSPYTIGFSDEEIFEVRLIPVGDTWIFTKGFCFHPAEARKYILTEIKRYRKNTDLNPDELMLRLVKMRYKYEQYKHVKLEMIYTNENKLGV